MSKISSTSILSKSLCFYIIKFLNNFMNNHKKLLQFKQQTIYTPYLSANLNQNYYK